MMIDVIETIGNSKIQHGYLNNRVYIIYLDSIDIEKVLNRTYKLCEEFNYSKIFAKTLKTDKHIFLENGFEPEATIPNFYNGTSDCVFMSKFLDKNRLIIKNKDELDKVFNITKNKSLSDNLTLNNIYTIAEMQESDAESMAALYQLVFKSYPFPIFDKNYLIQTMKENVIYHGIKYENKLISLASAETSKKYLNSEMTDFATHPDFRGKGFALILLQSLERKMIAMGFKTLYTISRAKSCGINITFKKCGYIYSGLLKNNTNISGYIESMNVWYKHI